MLDQAQIDGFKDGSKESMSGEIVPVQKENQMTIDIKELRRLAQAATPVQAQLCLRATRANF